MCSQSDNLPEWYVRVHQEKEPGRTAKKKASTELLVTKRNRGNDIFPREPIFSLKDIII